MAEEWKKRLLPGSFRGIPFFIESHTLKGGRNAVAHEPVDRDTTSSEDTGIKAKVFSVTFHVLGDNYFFLRDAFIGAGDNRDVGILVHPYLGIKEVRAEGYELTEITSEGRIAVFTMEFIEAGNPSFPIAAIDAVTSLITDVVTTVAQVQNAFQLAFKIGELPGFAVNSSVLLVKKFASDLKSSFKNFRVLPESQADLTKRLKEIEDNAESLVQNPASLAGAIEDVLSDLSGLIAVDDDKETIDSSSGRDEKLDVFKVPTEFDSGYEDIPENTPTREREKANSKALEILIIHISICYQVQEIAIKDFISKEQAIDIRNAASEKIAKQLLIIDDDEEFQVMQDLNSSMVLAVPNPNDQLAETKTINLAIETPSLVLTYDLFEDATKEADIITRNRVKNPGFLIGDIEVLGA